MALKTVPHHPCTQNTHANMLSSEDFVPTDRPADLWKLILSTHQWLPVIPPRPPPIPDLTFVDYLGVKLSHFKVDLNSIMIHHKCPITSIRPIHYRTGTAHANI